MHRLTSDDLARLAASERLRRACDQRAAHVLVDRNGSLCIRHGHERRAWCCGDAWCCGASVWPEVGDVVVSYFKKLGPTEGHTVVALQQQVLDQSVGAAAALRPFTPRDAAAFLRAHWATRDDAARFEPIWSEPEEQELDSRIGGQEAREMILVARGHLWPSLMVPRHLAAREIRAMGVRLGAFALSLVAWCLLVSSAPRSFLPAHILVIHSLPQGHRDPATVVLFVEVSLLALLWMLTTPRRAYFLHLFLIGTFWALGLPTLPGAGHPIYAGIACATILIEWQAAARLSLAIREDGLESRHAPNPLHLQPAKTAPQGLHDHSMAMV